ncbi:uncharacterized LOC729966 homolog [Acomys russatus]|uniref:uncharacterized LOC729966 homolog n=1 Tax=Acomys russatus TaxID=60746 RepID=UPI0021E1C8D1|nr:uncharacterized LOC729966 homolog [Acomys russatus]
MAGSTLLPLALALLLLARPGDSSVILALSEPHSDSATPTSGSTTRSSEPHSDSATPTSGSTTPSSKPHSDSTTASLETTSPPDSSSVEPNPSSAYTEPETASLPSSGSPSSVLTTASWSTPSAPSPGLDAGSQWISTSHRNPGVVIAVCLLVSALLIGSVFTAVRHCNRDVPSFHNLDTVSMSSVSQRLPFADRLQL